VAKPACLRALEGLRSRLRPCSPLLRRASRGAIVRRLWNDGGRRSSHRGTRVKTIPNFGFWV